MSQIRRVVINRNPRNLEKLGIARRPTGYHFEKDRDFRQYYYQIDFEKTNHHTSAFIRHVKDGHVLQASTREFSIASRLHSNTDVSAAYNIGAILARRCLQAGIHFVHRGIAKEELDRSERIQAFCRAMEEGGVSLSELPVIEQERLAEIKEFENEVPAVYYNETREFILPKGA